MNRHPAFEAAFEDELRKTAGWFDALMGGAGKLVGGLMRSGAGSAAAGAVERAGAGAAADAAGGGIMRALGRGTAQAGQALSKYPRVQSALRFGAGQTLSGLGFAAAEAPFRKREKVVQVLPYPDKNQVQSAWGGMGQQGG